MLLDTISTGLSAPTSSGLGIAATTLSLAASYEIGQYFKSKDTEGSAAHILAHTILGAAVAVAGGNDALLAGVSAGGAEASAPLLAKYLYGKESKDLTVDEKGTVSAITGLVASGLGATTGDVSSTVQSGQVAQNAVENNQMTLPFQVNNQRMQSAQSLYEHGVKEGWSPDKLQEAVSKELRGRDPQGEAYVKGWVYGSTTLPFILLASPEATLGTLATGGLIGGGADVAIQHTSDKPYDYKDTVYAAGVGAVTQGKSALKTIGINAVAESNKALIKGNDIKTAGAKGATATTASIILENSINKRLPSKPVNKIIAPVASSTTVGYISNKVEESKNVKK